MKRNNFIKILTALAGGAVLIPSGLYLASPGQKKLAEQTIYKELHYLKLDPQGVTQFVEDYFKGSNPGFKEKMKWKAYFFLNSGTKGSDNLFQVVRAYLLSSDFFLNKTDVSKTVKYLGMFNPYKSQVPNPYSYVIKYK